jgi:hypothetical protein
MRNIILTVFLAAGTLLLNAQNAVDSIPDPEFMNQVFAWGKDHKLTSLEKKDAEYVSKTKAAGFGGSKQMYQMDGGKSTVTVSPDNLMFVVSTSGGGGMGMDPSSQFALLKFETKKDKRQAVAAEYGGMMKKPKSGDNELEVNFKRIREGVIRIVPAKPLDKGEYAFLNKLSVKGGGMSMKMEAFAFSIE